MIHCFIRISIFFDENDFGAPYPEEPNRSFPCIFKEV